RHRGTSREAQIASQLRCFGRSIHPLQPQQRFHRRWIQCQEWSPITNSAKISLLNNNVDLALLSTIVPHSPGWVVGDVAGSGTVSCGISAGCVDGGASSMTGGSVAMG